MARTSAAELDAVRQDAVTCTACPLYRDATQTVFGSGPRDARVMMVGEQPGDQEDRAGEPFVGPAGRVLDKALTELGIERDSVYLTNAVKHFKFKRAERGKRRIHQTPSRTEVVACKPWLDAELRLVEPEFVVLLGSVAAKALMGPSFTLTPTAGSCSRCRIRRRGPCRPHTPRPCCAPRTGRRPTKRSSRIFAFWCPL